MTPFTVRDGQFWLNAKPLFIQAGELHYFRIPAEQWPHRLQLLQTAGFNTVATYIPWLWHQPQSNLSDLVGQTHPLRNLAGFLDLAAEMGLFIIARPGPYIMAETINEGIPPWVFSQNPQAAFLAQNGQTHNLASYLHPDFLQCVTRWYQAVFQVLAPRQITRGGKILLIQLDNEMGMPQWVRNIVDINPDTLEQFAAYVNENNNEHAARHFPNPTSPEFLREQITHPQPPAAALVLEAYRRFYRTYLREYLTWLWSQARACGMEVPPVVNIHGFGNGGKTFPIGLSQLAGAIGVEGMVSATDVYPIFIGEGNFHQLQLVNEMTKAVQNPHQPLFSIEFQAGGNQDFGGAQTSLAELHSRLCIASGMRAINHYLFFDGENDPVLSPVKRHDWGHPVRKDGSLRRHYFRYPKLSRVLNAYGEDLVLAKPQTVASIGFLLDDFMTEVNNEATEATTKIITHQRDVILFDFIARGLALTHRPFTAIELSQSPLNVAQTPVLWVMLDKRCDAAVQQKLADYVEAGGQLIVVGRMCEETFNHTPCAILSTALGLQPRHSDPPFTPTRLRVFDYPDIPVSFLETYQGEFAEIFATTADGQPVGIIKPVGRGRVMWLGAALSANTLEDLDLFHQMANRMGCAPLFTTSAWADVQLSQGEKGRFLFINNYQDDALETTLACNGQPLFSGQTLTLPARWGAILPLDWQARPGVIIHSLTSEIVEIVDNADQLIFKTEAREFTAEISVTHYQCAPNLILQQISPQRVKLRGLDGTLTLTRA